MVKKSLFTPTRYSKEPFLINGNSRCGDCEKENADYFFKSSDRSSAKSERADMNFLIEIINDMDIFPLAMRPQWCRYMGARVFKTCFK